MVVTAGTAVQAVVMGSHLPWAWLCDDWPASSHALVWS